MKPIVIVPNGAMTPESIKELRDNGICVVEASDPALVKFLDPIPSAAERTSVEDAAIKLSRKLLSRECGWDESTRASIAKTYVDILVKGTRLDPAPPQAEVERKIFDQAKTDELVRLAKEEARVERKAEADRLAAAREAEAKAKAEKKQKALGGGPIGAT